MNNLPETIERILSLGGGVSINSSEYTPENLERFAAFASRSGSFLILNKCKDIPMSTLERVSALGKGKVIFNLQEIG